MKRFAIFVWLLLALPVGAQDIPLEIKGADVKVVKVDRVVIVKDDLLVVGAPPFTVHAPPGAGLYFWMFPAGVQAVDKGDRLEITAAAKGSLTVSVKLISANLDKEGRFIGFLTKFGQTTFAVGGVEPPIPPKPPIDPPKPIEKVTAVTYVYEKDQTAIPNQVLSALNRLNRERKILATAIEADVKDGTGDVPAQYRVALEAAKKAGLPALVVTAGDVVLAVLQNPKTEQEVIDAVGNIK